MLKVDVLSKRLFCVCVFCFIYFSLLVFTFVFQNKKRMPFIPDSNQMQNKNKRYY